MKLACGALLNRGPTIAIVALAMAWPMSGARPQAARTVKVVVPYPPGGGADVVARVLANAIGEMRGPTMVVENRPGAGTVIGTEDVVHAAPDGNTLLMANNALDIVPHIRKLDFDPFVSLVPMCQLATTPTIIVVNSASPYRTLGELLNAARAKPGELTFGALPGALSDISWGMLLHRANVRMTLVPFTGTAPMVNALLGGQIDAVFVDYPSTAGLAQSGKLRVLATASAKRIDWLPDVPTVIETGYEGFVIELWYGVFAPAHTSHQTVTQFSEWFSKAALAPATQSRLLKQGIAATSICGSPFLAYLKNQYAEYGEVIRDADINQ